MACKFLEKYGRGIAVNQDHHAIQPYKEKAPEGWVLVPPIHLPDVPIASSVACLNTRLGFACERPKGHSGPHGWYWHHGDLQPIIWWYDAV